MPVSPYTEIPHVETAQSQKEVTLNAALDQLDGELNGQLSKTLTSSDVTLTDAEALFNFYVKVTGAFTANRTLTIPANKKVYAVSHGGTGGFSLTVKTSGGTGVALAQGEIRLVFCDGVDTTALTPATAPNDPFDLAGYIPGLPGDGAVILRFVAARALQLPAGLPNSQGAVGTAPTTPAVFSLRKNGVQFGLASFASAATTCTFTATAATNFVAGDLLSIAAPSPQDSTLAELAITLASVRT
jgi:hypothetical protein